MPIKANRIRDGGGTPSRRGGAPALQDPISGCIVEKLIAARCPPRSRPGRQTPFIVVAHRCARLCPTGTTLTPTGIDVAARHIAHHVIAGIGVGNGTQARSGMDMGGIPITHRSRRSLRDPVNYIIPERLALSGRGAPTGRRSTMIASRWRSRIACPRHPIQGIVTERLGIGETASTASGERSGKLEDIACILVGLLLTPERTTGSHQGCAAGDEALHPIVAQYRPEKRCRHTCLIGRSPNGKPCQLSTIDVADLTRQECDWITTRHGS